MTLAGFELAIFGYYPIAQPKIELLRDLNNILYNINTDNQNNLAHYLFSYICKKHLVVGIHNIQDTLRNHVYVTHDVKLLPTVNAASCLCLFYCDLHIGLCLFLANML